MVKFFLAFFVLASVALGALGAANRGISATAYDVTKQAAKDGNQQTTVVAIGGDGSTSVDIIVLDNRDSNSYTNKSGAPAPKVRWQFAGAVVNNNIYIVGGSVFHDDDKSNHFWSYSIANDTWNVLPEPPMEVLGGSAAVLDNKIYLTTGVGNSEIAYSHDALYAFDVTNNTWSTLPGENPCPGCYVHCFVAQNQSLFHFFYQDLHRSDDEGKSWQKMAPAKVFRAYTACAALGTDAIIVAGGYGNGSAFDALNSVEIFNVTTNSWKDAAPMHVPRMDHAAATMPNGKDVLVCGGSNYSPPSNKNSCELYDSAVDKWTVTNYTLAHFRNYFGLFVSPSVV